MYYDFYYFSCALVTCVKPTLNWVPVSSTGKVFVSCIRDLGLISTYTKNWLVSWSDDKRTIIKSGCYRLKLSKKKLNA